MDPVILDPAIVDLAQNCLLMRRARVLSAWVGAGKPVTAKGVLRRADVDPAALALGVPPPGRVRTAADVWDIHRPWVAAEAVGLLAVGLDRAEAGVPAEADPVNQWFAGMGAVLRAESVDGQRTGAAILCHAVLHALGTQSIPDVHHLEHAVERALGHLDWMETMAAIQAFRRDVRAVQAALEFLGECGAVDATTMTLTPLGQWATNKLAEPLPPPLEPSDAAARAHQIFQLKIALRRFQPPVWRRVLVPGWTDLGLLHRIIQIMFDWDDDHLHAFRADGMHYADPCHELEECADENDTTLVMVLPRPGAKIHYTYDFGDSWEHTITLERLLDDHDGMSYPSCVGGRGDAPVEDWSPDWPEEPTPFDRDEINKALAALTVPGRRSARQ